jgi:heme/copper-type cytochrome/quinol oxidase subunit 1
VETPPTPDLDLRDTRGRLRRLGIAAAVGFVVTALVMHWINSVSRAPNSDPIGSSAVPLLAIGMFVVVTALGVAVLARLARRG